MARGEPRRQAILGAVADFEKANPGVKVVLSEIPLDQYFQKVAIAFDLSPAWRKNRSLSHANGLNVSRGDCGRGGAHARGGGVIFGGDDCGDGAVGRNYGGEPLVSLRGSTSAVDGQLEGQALRIAGDGDRNLA